MTTLPVSEKLSIARSVAARYVRRGVHWMDKRDLEQQAMVAMVEAEPYWSPLVGSPLGAYLRRAAVLSTGRYLWQTCVDVSVPINSAREACRDLVKISNEKGSLVIENNEIGFNRAFPEEIFHIEKPPLFETIYLDDHQSINDQ